MFFAQCLNQCGGSVFADPDTQGLRITVWAAMAKVSHPNQTQNCRGAATKGWSARHNDTVSYACSPWGQSHARLPSDQLAYVCCRPAPRKGHATLQLHAHRHSKLPWPRQRAMGCSSLTLCIVHKSHVCSGMCRAWARELRCTQSAQGATSVGKQQGKESHCLPTAAPFRNGWCKARQNCVVEDVLAHSNDSTLYVLVVTAHVAVSAVESLLLVADVGGCPVQRMLTGAPAERHAAMELIQPALWQV